MALTGTADDKMTARIKKQLAMSRATCSMILSPERANNRHTVMKVTKNVYLQHFKWVAEMVKTDGVNTPKTIIFCTSLSDVTMLVSNLFAMSLIRVIIHQTDWLEFQARRVDSVEGGSFMFWEVFFSARGANTCAEGASL